MHVNDNKIDLLQRNIQLFEDKELFIAGNIDSPLVLHIAKITKKCHILCDNFIIFKQIANTLNLDISNEISQTINYKHVYLHFFAIDEIKAKIQDNFDSVLLFLTKSKESIKKTLHFIQDNIKENSDIYIVGENASGGKSSDKLLEKTNAVYKIDTARKCTLFTTKYKNPFDKLEEKILSYSINDKNIKIISKIGVFSQNKIDDGTNKLLLSIKEHINTGSYLDLGCGCGVIGIYLALNGIKDITLSDISANALYASYENARLNNVSDNIKFVASDMLNNVNSFDNIISNPPFHDGIKISIDVTLAMLKELKEHLNKKGQVIIVGNTFLMYENHLKNIFNNSEILYKDTKFTVVKSLKM